MGTLERLLETKKDPRQNNQAYPDEGHGPFLIRKMIGPKVSLEAAKQIVLTIGGGGEEQEAPVPKKRAPS